MGSRSPFALTGRCTPSPAIAGFSPLMYMPWHLVLMLPFSGFESLIWALEGSLPADARVDRYRVRRMSRVRYILPIGCKNGRAVVW